VNRASRKRTRTLQQKKPPYGRRNVPVYGGLFFGWNRIVLPVSLLKKFVFVSFLSASQHNGHLRCHSRKFVNAENEIPESRLGLLVFRVAVAVIDTGNRSFSKNSEQRAASRGKTGGKSWTRN
jgi:hypothetical protein